mgnify:CR=1 FL=1
MTYESMAKDLLSYADEFKIEKFDIMGHSMGGKLAMHLALWYPEWVWSIIAIEAVPKNLSNHPDISFNTNLMMEKVRGVKIQGLTWKLAIDELMNTFHDQGFVNLLATNIIYEGETGESVKWAINLENIHNNF